MKNFLFLLLLVSSYTMFAQEDEINPEVFTQIFADNACSCIDSINVFDKSSKEISDEVYQCIDAEVSAYQLGSQLSALVEMDKDTTKEHSDEDRTISINTNKESEEYKKYYYKIERYLMENCDALKSKVAANETVKDNSLSDNPKALEWYSKGIDEGAKGNFKKAIKYYKKALRLDSKFAFAWDNIGLSYRKMEKYDDAIKAYKESLKIDPKGITPLQNLAVVYLHTKEYDKAIDAYERLAKVDENNPEVFYGIGLVHYQFKKEYEKGLDYMCKAYILYIKQNSPYRTDAEKAISNIYSAMKDQGEEAKFYEILEENGISPNKE